MRNKSNNEIVDRRRVQLKEAAYRLISRKGYGAVSIRDIAKEANMSTGLVHYYFKNKEDLLLNILSMMNQKLKSRTMRVLTKAESPVEKLRLFIDLAFSQINDEKEYYHVVIDFWSMAGRNERMRKANAKLFESYIDVCSLILREGVERGDFRDLDIDYMATLILSLIQGVIIRYVIDKRAFDYDEYSSKVVEQIIGIVVK